MALSAKLLMKHNQCLAPISVCYLFGFVILLLQEKNLNKFFSVFPALSVGLLTAFDAYTFPLFSLLNQLVSFAHLFVGSSTGNKRDNFNFFFNIGKCDAKPQTLLGGIRGQV